MDSEQAANPLFTAPCSHSFHFHCIKAAVLHGHRDCPICRSPLPSASIHNFHLFDDDEPLPAPPSPPPPPTATASIETFPEFPAVAAASFPSSFAVLIKTSAPPVSSGHHCHDRLAAVDLVAVLDVSDSMRGSKLAHLKHAVRFVVQSLSHSDRLAIVAFSHTASRILPLRLMSDVGQAEAAHAIDLLVASGATDIAGGLSTGIQILEERRVRNPVVSIILLSDGMDTMDIFRRLPRSAWSVAPIHTFGFGADHDAGIMHAVAEATGGTFSFVEEEEAISGAFATCLAGLLSMVAQRAQLDIISDSPGVSITRWPPGTIRPASPTMA